MAGGKRPRGRGERRALLATVAGAAAIALVAGVAVVAKGYERSEQSLSDASVWVSNIAAGKLGHANTAIGALSTALSLEGDGTTIAQDPAHVVLQSTAKNALVIVDPGQAKVTKTVDLPAGKPAVVSSGSWLGVVDPSSGDAWVQELADAGSFDAATAPTAELGPDAVLAVDGNGRWAGFSRQDSTLTVRGEGSGSHERIAFSGDTKRAQVTLVGDQPAVYNPESNELYFSGRVQSLAAGIDDPSATRLMQPTTARSPVVLTHGGGLVAVSGDNTTFTLPVEAMQGTGAAAVRSGSCVYAAWTSGRAAQWCDGRDPETFELQDSAGTGSLVLRENDGTVVANDGTNGNSWALQNGGALIRNWADFEAKQQVIERERDDLDLPPQTERIQKPPVARDDHFGARPGRSNILPVLLNDSDPNADSLRIASISEGIPAKAGTLEVLQNRQKLQLTLREGARGPLKFRYTIDDGKGGTAEATVTVDVVAPDVNRPPAQARTSKTSVASGGTVTASVLDDWVDPESDPMLLESARTDAPNAVSSTAQGDLEFTAAAGVEGVQTIDLHVSDGTATGEGPLNVTVSPEGQTPIIAENYTLSGYVGQQIATAPVGAARGGTGELVLSDVAEAPQDQVRVATSYAEGRVSITPVQAGTSFMPYTVKDATGATGTGTIRIDALQPPSTATDPIVGQTNATLPLGRAMDVDVLDQAIDPAGGVLSIVAPPAVPASSGVVVDVVDHEHLRVTLTKELPRPLTFKVDVSNGARTTTGEVTLMQAVRPKRLQAPVARNDSVSVRAGSVVDVAVLENDSQAQDARLTLSRDLPQRPKDGTLVVSGDRLRYLAPQRPGTYTARYTALSSDAQSASASVTFDVLGTDGSEGPEGTSENHPPSAQLVTARALPGQSVSIPLPVQGADPDGDAVSVQAGARAPSQGAITAVGQDSITYVPAQDAQGVDRFDYRLVDSRGASATGEVRVAVLGAQTPLGAPRAQDDGIDVRPDTELTIPVLDNDIDEFGQGLTIRSATLLSAGASVDVVGKTLQLHTPKHEATLTGRYTVEDASGATSTATFTVTVRSDAPRAAPTTQDRHLALADIEGQRTVTVDVLQRTSFTEGAVSGLAVSLPGGVEEVEGVSVDAQGRVLVPVGQRTRLVPFIVARKDAPELRALGTILVPGTKDTGPQRKAGSQKLTVRSGAELQIPLDRHVLSASGARVTLVEGSTPSAFGSDGSSLLKNGTTLRFRSGEGFVGRASITAQLTDGTSTSTVVLPIEVTGERAQAPLLRSAVFPVEDGTPATLSLPSFLVGENDPGDGATWELSSSEGAAVTAGLRGADQDHVLLTPRPGATAGTRQSLGLTLRRPDGSTSQATLEVAIVPSAANTVIATDDTTAIKRGGTLHWPVLENDAAPTGRARLSIVSVTALEDYAGLSAAVAPDGRALVVKASGGVEAGTLALAYEVQAGDDESTRATGQALVTVLGPPLAPSGAVRVIDRDAEKRTLTLSVDGADPQGSPVTGYQVSLDGAPQGTQTCLDPHACVVSGLELGQAHSFRMRAVNALGTGPWSASSPRTVLDLSPAMPQQLTARPSPEDRAGTSLLVSWGRVERPAGGSDIVAYDVRVKGDGLPGDGLVVHAKAEDSSIVVKDERLRPGSSYQLAVQARNQSSSSEPALTTVIAVAAPIVSGAKAVADAKGGKVTARWTADGRGGETRAKVAFAPSSVGEHCEVDDVGTSTRENSAELRLPAGGAQRMAIDVSNGVFCTRVFVDVDGSAP